MGSDGQSSGEDYGVDRSTNRGCIDEFFFKVGNKAIVDADGNPYPLKGFNIGGWLTYQAELFYSKGGRAE